MNYTPEDLKCLCFSRSLFDGYSRKQVCEFITKIREDYTQLIKDYNEMKNQMNVLNETLQHYKILEESLQHSIIVAQHTGEQIKANACEKAKNITEEAEFNAQKIIETANHEFIKAKGKYEQLKAEIFTFRTKSEALLQAQLEILKQMFNEDEK